MKFEEKYKCFNDVESCCGEILPDNDVQFLLYPSGVALNSYDLRAIADKIDELNGEESVPDSFEGGRQPSEAYQGSGYVFKEPASSAQEATALSDSLALTPYGEAMEYADQLKQVLAEAGICIEQRESGIHWWYREEAEEAAQDRARDLCTHPGDDIRETSPAPSQEAAAPSKFCYDPPPSEDQEYRVYVGTEDGTLGSNLSFIGNGPSLVNHKQPDESEVWFDPPADGKMPEWVDPEWEIRVMRVDGYRLHSRYAKDNIWDSARSDLERGWKWQTVDGWMPHDTPYIFDKFPAKGMFAIKPHYGDRYYVSTAGLSEFNIDAVIAYRVIK